MANLNSEKGIYLNGKEQVIELLQKMDAPMRQLLIENMRKRNPALTVELEKWCFSFEEIFKLPTFQIRNVVNRVDAKIFGIALQGLDVEKQRRALTALERIDAETAFAAMTDGRFSSSKDIQRARSRVCEVAKSLLN